MPIPPDAEAFNRWRLEAEQTEQLLTRLEAAERALLVALRCPPDPAGVFAMLKGDQPWPPRTSARNRQRAAAAMHVLALIGQTRGHLSFGSENSHRAVFCALLAAGYATDGAVRAMLAEAERQGGRKGGRQSAAQRNREKSRTLATVSRLVSRWRASDELQLQYRTATRYVQSQTAFTLRTVQRYVKALGLHHLIRRTRRSA